MGRIRTLVKIRGSVRNRSTGGGRNRVGCGLGLGSG